MTVNAASLSAGGVLKMLREGWTAQQQDALTASWMLHGRPGVGKSQIVQQLATEIGATLFDLRLTTIEPQDLRGLPYYDHTTQKTVWYRPEDLPDAPDGRAILFLDELTAASPYLQPTVYGLLQERRVGRHLLPASVMIIAAGNTVQDGAIAYEMGTALSDRLIHVVLEADADDWLENYAGPKGLSPTVTAFLRGRPDLLETTQDALARGEMIACTPRAWERVSEIMTSISPRAVREAMIAGTVGDRVSAEFMSVADEILATVNIEDLLEAAPSTRASLFPTTLDGLNAVVFGLVGALDDARLEPVIVCMDQVRHLHTQTQNSIYAGLPLRELSSFGFEMLMTKAFDLGLDAAFAASRTYQNYAAERQAAGLD